MSVPCTAHWSVEELPTPWTIPCDSPIARSHWISHWIPFFLKQWRSSNWIWKYQLGIRLEHMTGLRWFLKMERFWDFWDGLKPTSLIRPVACHKASACFGNLSLCLRSAFPNDPNGFRGMCEADLEAQVVELYRAWCCPPTSLRCGPKGQKDKAEFYAQINKHEKKYRNVLKDRKVDSTILRLDYIYKCNTFLLCWLLYFFSLGRINNTFPLFLGTRRVKKHGDLMVVTTTSLYQSERKAQEN